MSRRVKDCGKPECEACKELFAEHRRVREAMKRRKARNVYQCGRCLGEYTTPVMDGWMRCPHCFGILQNMFPPPKIIGHQEYHPSHVWYIPSTWFSGVWVMYTQKCILK